MDAADRKAIAACNAERDAVLIQDNLPAFMDWVRGRGQDFSCDDVAEITMHKVRTAITSIPMELRSKSKKWLQSRGMECWDDGDVPGLLQ